MKRDDLRRLFAQARKLSGDCAIAMPLTVCTMLSKPHRRATAPPSPRR